MKSSRTPVVFAVILAMAVFGALVPGEGSAATYTLTPVADAFVDSSNAAGNYGNWQWMDVYRHDGYGGVTDRAFLKFDLKGIAAGETIVGAKLSLYAFNFYGPQDTALHYVETDGWSESTLTWNNMPAYGSRLDLKTASSWGSPPQPGVSVLGMWDLFAAPGAWNPSTDLTDGFLSLLLKLDPESGSPTGYSFASKEMTYLGTGIRPYLTVETSVVPLPPSILLFGSGLLGTIFISRRRSGR